MSKSKWIICWYDCDEETDEGVVTHEEKLPYRISFEYLSIVPTDWKYARFPNRNGTLDTWKRYEYAGEALELDEPISINDGEPTTVRELPDITQYLAHHKATRLSSEIADLERHQRILRAWRTANVPVKLTPVEPKA